MISTLVWVPRGASKNKENEVEEFISSNVITGEDEDLMQSDGSSDSSSVSVNDVLASDLKSLTHQEVFQEGSPTEEQDEEEREDLQYRETDAVVICGLTENEVSSLVFYIVEETQDGLHMYPHHDIVLSSFPLSLAWSNVSSLDGWNCHSCVAVGSLIPQIEIYDASAIDELEPIAVLGETRMSKLATSASSVKKRTKRRPKKVDSEYHTDSVLSLSWNVNDKQYLASGSADCTIRCWDVTTCKSVRTWLHHEKEVQSVCWHEQEATLLLCGSFDQTVSLLDTRVDQNVPSFRLSVDSDVETVSWVPISWGGDSRFKFLVTLENGTMQILDSRMINSENPSASALLTCKAHEKAVSSCAFSKHFKGLLVTGSLDESLKLWDCKEDRPQLVKEWNKTGVGAIFATQFCQDEETSNWLALSGSKGKLELLNIFSVGDSLVQHFPECCRFGSRLSGDNSTPAFVGVYSDAESASSDSD